MKPTTRLIVSLVALSLPAITPGLRGQDNPTLTTLHSFTGTGTEGAFPFAGVVQGGDGNFYGTTALGPGDSGLGTVFRVTPEGVHTTLHAFTGTGTDGNNPKTGLIQGSDGGFYGTTTSGGGSHDAGAVFRILPSGEYTNVHGFTGTGTEGSLPEAGLIQDADGNFYGTTEFGGSPNAGTVFRLTPQGVLTTLHTFRASRADKSGLRPVAGLVLGSDGAFYGTTPTGGDSQDGTVFRLMSSGAYATLHSFTGTGMDGNDPVAGLIQGSDGNFYGTTTKGGGASNGGSVFRITPTGVLTTLHGFTRTGTDGFDPLAGLIEASDGNFYGTTAAGGSHDSGTIFRITPAGVHTTLYSFSAPDMNGDNSDGSGPNSGLIQGSDGNFYGTTQAGGHNDSGVVFRLNVVPAITSALSATATQGAAFSYQITATNGPTHFGVLGLPPGVKVDGKTGLISGTPTTMGTKMLTLKATNALGVGEATLTLNIAKSPPNVTSASTATATVGQAFNYQITATNQPTSFGVLGLPPGLHVDGKTGVISGTPTKAGTKMLTLKATNAGGTGQATLTLTIKSS